MPRLGPPLGVLVAGVLTGAVLLTLLAPRSAPGGTLPSAGRSPHILLRLDGMLQTDRQRGVIGFTVLSLGLLGGHQATRFLAVTDARTVGGNPGVLAKNVLDAVRPYEPDLLVKGPAPLLEKLYAGVAGDRVTLEGLVNVASRTYFLREALLIPAAPTTTTTIETSTTLPTR